MGADFKPLRIAVLTVSDTRSLDTDASGQLLADQLQAAGHVLAARALLRDDVDAVRAQVAAWVGDDGVEVVLTTGGTGITGRDGTPEAIAPLLDKTLEGFGELFRMLSYAEIGAATIQSRCLAGVARGTLVFCLPGSSGACRLGWEKILRPQLDSRTRPCNFAELLPRLRER
ncbi:MAG TPA: molybdenum cofactor biosynthesis protein B [Nevskiales bacterium]|nr:molybdenum cofactor biosynthesis protein B [Nevskiales bacterium]